MTAAELRAKIEHHAGQAVLYATAYDRAEAAQAHAAAVEALATLWRLNFVEPEPCDEF